MGSILDTTSTPQDAAQVGNWALHRHKSDVSRPRASLSCAQCILTACLSLQFPNTRAVAVVRSKPRNGRASVFLKVIAAVAKGEAITHVFGNSLPRGILPTVAMLGEHNVKDAVRFTEEPNPALPVAPVGPLRCKYMVQTGGDQAVLQNTGLFPVSPTCHPDSFTCGYLVVLADLPPAPVDINLIRWKGKRTSSSVPPLPNRVWAGSLVNSTAEGGGTWYVHTPAGYQLGCVPRLLVRLLTRLHPGLVCLDVALSLRHRG